MRDVGRRASVLTKRPVRLTLFALCLVLSLTGCDSSGKLAAELNEYRSRLSSVVDKPEPEVSGLTPLTYPAFSTLRHTIPDMTINLREFYGLPGCDIVQLVGQRNTALGKTHTPSFRYVYEVDLINALEACIVSADEQTEATLRQWLAAKREALPLAWANMLQLSPEMRRMLTHNSGYVTNAADDQFNALWQALKYLSTLRGSTDATREEVESALKTINNHPIPAKMIRSQQQLISQLSVMTPWLERHTAELPCKATRQEANVTYLNNVFSKFFIARIQPTAANINQYHYKLEPVFGQLIAEQSLHPEFKALLQKHFDTFEVYRREMSEHVEFWQQLLDKCDLQPVMTSDS